MKNVVHFSVLMILVCGVIVFGQTADDSLKGFMQLWSWDSAGSRIDACVNYKGFPAVFTSNGTFERLRIADGKPIKTVELGARPVQTPLIIDEKAVFATQFGTLACYDLTTGQQVWVVENVGHVSAATLNATTVLVGLSGESKGIAGFDVATGKRVFEISLSEPILSPPLAYAGKIWAAGIGGTLFAVSPESQSVIDSFHTSGEFYQQRIMPANEFLLVSAGGYHRRIEALSVSHPLVKGPVWSTSFVRPSYLELSDVQAALFQRPARRAMLLKKAVQDYSSGNTNNINEFVPIGPVYMSSWVEDCNDAAIVVREEGIPPHALYHVIAANAVSGKESLRISRLVESTSSMVCVNPILTRDALVACIGKSTILSVNRATGTVEWEQTIPDAQIDNMMVSANQLIAHTTDGSVVAFQAIKPMALPQRFVVRQNTPNPFRVATMIRYEIPRTTRVSIEVFNSSGRLMNVLERDRKEPGFYKIKWDGTDSKGVHLAAGTYILRIKTTALAKSIRMTLLR